MFSFHSGEHGLNFKETMQLLRLAICGLTKGPSIGEVIEILGPDECLRRIQKSLNNFPVNGVEAEKRIPHKHFSVSVFTEICC